MTRLRSVRLAGLTVLLSLLGPVTASATTGDPASNRSLSQGTLAACSNDPSSSACITAALADINAARAAEGVPAMVLPSDFATMSVPVQLLNLSNLERVDRGLPPILGLSAALNQDAQAGAARDADPMPTHFYGNTATSNWAGGDASALEADFEWMYDDGLGSGNLDCTSSNQSGCWGHRHDILWHFSTPIAMGAGLASGQYGPSMTELFVGGDTQTGPGQPDAPIARPSQPATATASSAGAKTAAPAAGSSSAGPGRPPAPLRLKAHCTSAHRRCVLLVTVTVVSPTGSKPPTSTLTVTVRAGAPTSIRVPLSRAVRRLLSSRHKLRVRVTITQDGKRTLLSRLLTLRTPA